MTDNVAGTRHWVHAKAEPIVRTEAKVTRANCHLAADFAQVWPARASGDELPAEVPPGSPLDAQGKRLRQWDSGVDLAIRGSGGRHCPNSGHPAGGTRRGEHGRRWRRPQPTPDRPVEQSHARCWRPTRCGEHSQNRTLRLDSHLPSNDAPMDCQERIVNEVALRTPPERRSA